MLTPLELLAGTGTSQGIALWHLDTLQRNWEFGSRTRSCSICYIWWEKSNIIITLVRCPWIIDFKSKGSTEIFRMLCVRRLGTRKVSGYVVLVDLIVVAVVAAVKLLLLLILMCWSVGVIQQASSRERYGVLHAEYRYYWEKRVTSWLASFQSALRCYRTGPKPDKNWTGQRSKEYELVNVFG